MATSILKSIKGKTVRLTRLDECGDVVAGTCTTLVSDCFVSVTLSAEVEEGDEYLLKNAWGEPCVLDKNADFIKWVNVSIDFAEINPDALDIITGANPVISGSDTIGATYGQDLFTGAFALEVWTKRANGDCVGGVPDWGYFLVPFLKNGRLDGDVTIENGTLTVSVAAQGWPTQSWGDGPYTPNPFVESFPNGDLFGMVTTSEQPPSDTGGCIGYTPS